MYVARKIVKIGQSHYQPGEEIPKAEEMSNLEEMIREGFISREAAPVAAPAKPPSAVAPAQPPVVAPSSTPPAAAPRPMPTGIPGPGKPPPKKK